MTLRVSDAAQWTEETGGNPRRASGAIPQSLASSRRFRTLSRPSVATRPPAETMSRCGKTKKDIEKQADSITDGLSSLGNIAFERELENLVCKLREQPNTMWTLSKLMEDDMLKDILSGAGKRDEAHDLATFELMCDSKRLGLVL